MKFDIEAHKADMARARDAGITFDAVRTILADYLRDDDDGASFGRTVEALRELAVAAAERMSQEPR